MVRLGALVSGGKDSVFAVYKAIESGHQVCCLITIHPESPESFLLHHPGTAVAALQACMMDIPWYCQTVSTTDEADESAALNVAIKRAVSAHHIEGLVHGGIRSKFQRRRFEELCEHNCLDSVAPLWGQDYTYLQDMLQVGFRFIVVSVSSGGLDGSWLGRVVTKYDIARLESLATSCGLAPDFEGGEAETLVVDCPLFRQGIVLCGIPHWDGYRGFLEITNASVLYT